MLLETAYFPPVEYFALMAKDFTLSKDGVIPSRVYIEACENFQKQSYRNRCVILSESGPLPLSVPIVHEGGTISIPIRSVRIDWSVPWLQRTKRAIDSAYRTSPYFDYYRDDLYNVLDREREFLFDMNLDIIGFFLQKAGIACDILFTERFIPKGDYASKGSPYGEDFRGVIHPKHPNDVLSSLGLDKEYWQVFKNRYGFVRNLSMMDLLFNEGPDSLVYIHAPVVL